MESMKKEKNSSWKSFGLGGLLGAAMTLSVLLGGFGSATNRDKATSVTAKARSAAAPVATGTVEPGWADAEHDVLDLQLD